MKIFLLCLLLIFSFETSADYSKNRYNYVDFSNGNLYQGFGEGDTPEVARSVFSKNKKLEMGDEFMVKLTTTNRGLDIFIFTPESCDSYIFEVVTLNVSDQNIEFFKECDEYSSYLAKTEKGRDFFVEMFKKSDFIRIENLDRESRTVLFNAFGFSKMWIKLGGDSL